MLLAKRYVSLVFFQIQRSDKLLNLIDCKWFIHFATGTCILTTTVTDCTADHWEWVILLDELQCVFITSLCSHLDVTLDSQVYRTCSLTWCGTGWIYVDLRIIAIVVVPLVYAPLTVIRKLGLRILYSAAVLLAQLLSKLCSTYRTYLYALTTCYTLLFFYVCAICGCGHVRCIE